MRDIGSWLTTFSKLVIDGKRWTRPAYLAGLVVIIAILPLIIKSQYTLHILIITFVYIVAAVSFRAITISGQFPLAQGAFMGVGAYVAGMVSKWLGWSPWFTIPLGGFISGGMGMLFGYPFSRLRAMYYAMGSLFFGMAVINLIQAGGRVTGGYVGLSGIQPLFTSKISYYYFFLGLSLVSIIAMYRFEFSRIGVTLKAISQSYIVASSVGINESKYRVLAVGVGCFFVGLIGAAYAHYYGIASPVSYNLSATFWILMYALIGGVSTFAGPIIGVPILYLIPQYFSALKEYSPYLIAVMLAIVVYLMPNGIVGLFQSISSRYVKHKNIYL